MASVDSRKLLYALLNIYRVFITTRSINSTFWVIFSTYHFSTYHFSTYHPKSFGRHSRLVVIVPLHRAAPSQ